jgi:hypothetical protein
MPIIGPDKSKPKSIAAMIVGSMDNSTDDKKDGDLYEAGRIAMLEFMNAFEGKEPARAFDAYVRVHEIADEILEMSGDEPEAEEGY